MAKKPSWRPTGRQFGRLQPSADLELSKINASSWLQVAGAAIEIKKHPLRLRDILEFQAKNL